MENTRGSPDNWRQDALCSDFADRADMWYSDETSTQASLATSICFACPVRQECLKEACTNKEPFGIWGGLPASVRMKRGRAHNFLKLINLLDPYDTEDRESPFHISNLGDVDERE